MTLVLATNTGGAGLFVSDNVYDEVPSGTINGVNTVFTTANDFISTTIRVYFNGLRERQGGCYTVTDTNEITFTSAPKTGDEILVDYIK